MTPEIHLRCLSVTLCKHIGKICQVYVNDIAIWSKSIEEHKVNIIAKVLQTLAYNKLYCNPKKSKLFCLEIHFLGHWISAKGIEVYEGQADQVMNWLQSTSAKQVHRFLRSVCYLVIFLSHLVYSTAVLDKLTWKECVRLFLAWTMRHQTMFKWSKPLSSPQIASPQLIPHSCVTEQWLDTYYMVMTNISK